MGFLKHLTNKVKGIDPLYNIVQTEQIRLYQHYFEKVINSIDVNTQTNWSLNKPYSQLQFKKDEETMERIILGEAAREGLHPGMLQVMVHQYFFADVYQRENDRGNWVKRVMYRKETDYFPDATRTRMLLNAISG